MTSIKKISTVCFFILFSMTCFSQSYELGKVTVAELEEKEHPIEKDAEAAVLFNIGKTFFEFDIDKGFKLVTEVTTKIKVYKKEGYSFADISVPIYVGDSEKETVSFSKTFTYNLVNGKIEKTKMKSDGEFTEKVNKYWSVVKISLPNVREGSIIEYKYELTSPFLSNLPEWYFQKSIPVNFSKYETIIPEYLVYNPRIKGYVLPKVTASSKNTRYNYTEKDRSGNRVSKTSFSYENIDYKESITTYILEMSPSMKDEDFVSNIKDYTAGVSHELSIIKYPNSPIKTLSYSWEDVCKSIYDNENFGSELKKAGYFETDIEQLLQGKNTREEKIVTLLEYVKKQVKWNNFNGIFCDDGLKSAYKNRTGNVAEINLMLVSMLRFAGLEANPVLVSTKSNGIPLFPSRTAFNYVICAVEIPDGVIMLDATDMNSSLNIMPTRVLNWQGRLIRKEGSSVFVDLRPSFVSKENTSGLLSIDVEGNVSGKLRTQYFDYNAYRFRNNYLYSNNENYIESLEKKLGQIEIDDYLVTNENILSKPILEEFSFKHSDLIEIIGDKMYFSPLLFYSLNENPFKVEKRDYPIDFVYPQEDKYTITINLPEGYVVESVPQNTVFAIENSLLVYRFNLNPSEGKIQIGATLTINEAMITPNNYNYLKDFFKKVVENQTEKIVLKKI
ncbi:MAG TPA: DUF3857 domain-containing protein [Flavobacterium sp.]|uniref:transglutaminase domain-containing protein n=1 Tax=unclassified Flavobacterium TaxID=196869 RepID=UPI0025B9C97D|nr:MULTISPECIES: DUF3857 domain-containing protein [unclassified Flavobacterium]HRE77400.1 DUF3857 domain-containing protein [Flavobacterium sp.]